MTASTRSAIVDLLRESRGGMTAAELGRVLGRHPNGVRKQLEALRRSGAVGAEREAPGRRGRPPVRYRIAGEQRAAAAAQGLASTLAALVSEMAPGEEAVEEFGRRRAPQLAPGAGGRDGLLGLLTAMGFAPRETTSAVAARAGELEIVLGHCPFGDAVRAGGGATVCALHRGISRGLVEMSPGGRLTAFDIEAPERAGCRIAAAGLA